MEALSLNNLHRNTQTMRNAHRAHLNPGNDDSSTPMELDAMHVGDVTNHYQPPQQKRGPSGATVALLAGAIGLLAGPYISDLLKPDTEPPASVVKPDADTQYDLTVTTGK